MLAEIITPSRVATALGLWTAVWMGLAVVALATPPYPVARSRWIEDV